MTSIQATDRIGQLIDVGDIVAVPYTASMIKICTVEKITPKMVSVRTVATEKQGFSGRKRHTDVIRLNDIEDLVMYIMAN